MKANVGIKVGAEAYKKGLRHKVVSPALAVLFAMLISLLSSCVVYPVGYHHRHWHEDHWEYYR
ncbi:MAG TPA: hypothetical protein VK783_03040 [Bacteroidia bacterium]|jgi:hypothetical protein|nr:hypothetical protein [Bacteroidia bacterium]